MKRIIYLSILATFSSCGTKSTELSAATSDKNKVNDEQPVTDEIKTEKNPVRPAGAFPNNLVAEGSSLFNENCAKCHDLPIISKYSKEKWKKIVPSMAKEAKLDDTQENIIMTFVNWELQQQ